MMMLMMNRFCGMADRQKILTMFPVRAIVRDFDHGNSPTPRQQDLNLPRIRLWTLLRDVL